MDVKNTLIAECNAMVKFAFGSGLKVPDKIVEVLQSSIVTLSNKDENKDENDLNIYNDEELKCMENLAIIHNKLVVIISPAKPNTLVFFEKENKKKIFGFLGPVALIRRMMTIAILSLISLIIISISPEVNGSPESFGLTTNHGYSLLINQLFLMSAASIGASFAALFQVSEYIKNATYNPMYESTYWVRFVLGLLAGTMLATLIPIDIFTQKETVTTLNQGFERPILALLGGFSASVVFRILTRLTSTIESLFKGDAKELIATQEAAFNIKMQQQSMQARLEMLNSLKEFQSKLSSGQDINSLQEELNKIQNSLMNQNP